MAVVFEKSYYRITKLLLKILGRWPDHDTRRYKAREAFIGMSLMSFLVTQVLKLVTSWQKLDVVMAVIPVTLTFVTSIVKFYTFVLKRETLKCLLDRMHSDWETIVTKEETLILQKHAEDVKLYTKIYAFMMYLTLTLFVAVPMVPTALDIWKPLNETRPRLKLVEGEYLVEYDEYYYSIICHQFLASSIVVTIIAATDTMYIVYILHACAMLAIVGHHLEHSLGSYNLESCRDQFATVNKDATLNQKITRCINNHMRAIEFADMIETTFTYSLLIISLCDVIALSCSLMQVLLMMHNLEDATRYGLFVGAQMVHMLVHSVPGQRLIDQSIEVSTNLYNSKWYEMPTKSQKLLLLTMRRSMEPCTITAGKVITFSLASFSAVLQTSVSYFTMLRSIQ